MKVVDMHCDTISQLYRMPKENLFSNSLSVDINKLKKADSMVQFFAMFIFMKKVKNPYLYCKELINKLKEEVEKNKGVISIVKNYEDIINNQQENKLSAFMTIEEGGAIKGDLSKLKEFYDLGIRLMTLTWNFENEIGYPNFQGTYINNGLKKFGIETVELMNELGMIVDVSHLSDGGFYDVAKYSKYPFVASHSNARAVCNHTRNLTDEMIKILSDKGGVMGINFERSFISSDNQSTVDNMVKHIKHIRNVGGIDVIGLGTDFDGIDSDGIEINNIGDISLLSDGLKKNGFTEREIEKIYFKNTLRVIKDTIK